MAIFNNGNNPNDGPVAVEGGPALAPQVNQELLGNLMELADMVDGAFEMPHLSGIGDRAILFFMTMITLSLNAITDPAEVDAALADIVQEVESFGAPPGGIDADWWADFMAAVEATRACLV